MKARYQIGLVIVGSVALVAPSLTLASTIKSNYIEKRSLVKQITHYKKHCVRTRTVCRVYRHCDELKPRGYYSGCYWCTRNYRGRYYSAVRTCSLSYMRYLRLNYSYSCNHYWVPKSYCRYYKRYRVCKVYCES